MCGEAVGANQVFNNCFQLISNLSKSIKRHLGDWYLSLMPHLVEPVPLKIVFNLIPLPTDAIWLQLTELAPSFKVLLPLPSEDPGSRVAETSSKAFCTVVISLTDIDKLVRNISLLAFFIELLGSVIWVKEFARA